MFASAMFGSIHKNSLGYERKLRAIERQLSEAAAAELRLEQQIASRLGEIADLHLERRPELEQQTRAVLERRDEEERALHRQLEQAESTISELLEKIDAREADLRRLKRQVADLLSGSGEFRRMLDSLEQEQARQHDAAVSQRELHEECARKLPRYREDERYAYLVLSGYGTQAYRAGPLRRFLDGWIARLCNFHENRRNELTLLAMRDALAKIEEDELRDISALSDQVAAATARAEESVGMRPVREELAHLNEAVQAEKKRANEIQAKLAPYARKTDARYVEARSLLAVELRSHTEEELMARVLQTPGVADDKLAREVVSLRNALQEQRRRTAELERQRADAEAKYQRAKELERMLRRRGYGRRHYRYGHGLNLASLLVGYMAGRITLDQAAGEIGEFREVVPEAFPYDHFPREGGFGGGGFDTADSFGGGDFFSTTDSF